MHRMKKTPPESGCAQDRKNPEHLLRVQTIDKPLEIGVCF
jgi:hypothetical protein